ncbi:MAG TPA: bifunctional UDP-N-acetylglucosamine diphosphorylase/glucosamine-1-phosphate N-acetyltransferase GlmU [Kofleriaceae bacterium]|nr:bifunctional UDP-N-acetylglucosamine diphosphorylase/glucosamine-1-phosphate N-acetyltransferase GlmU [Kofleriaceae bacterium]
MDTSEKPVVLILAAGLGTRMKSEVAKVLHRVAGRSLIAWAVDNARAAGAGRVIAVLGHQADQVAAHLDARYGAGAVEVAMQVEQRGTGHAVLSALPALASEPDDRIVVILSGDAPLLQPYRVAGLVDACAASRAGLALLSTRPDVPVHYGRLLRDDAGVLTRIVEHPDATEEQRRIDEMNAGFYAVRLRHLRAGLGQLRDDNAKRELYLTDLAAQAAERGGAAVIEAPFAEVAGINDRHDLARTEAAARRRINDGWIDAGVTLVAPELTFIDADVGPIGRDTWIAANVCLRGRTRIGERALIDVGCVLTDVVVDADAQLRAYSVATESELGPRAQLGPFTHCRPGTRLDDGAKLGNFVETKKTHMQAGAKANHLAYLGDASVGAKANIGAGTITCNYDGFNKYRTNIEAGAFIGSDTQLVAPVTVGKNAYVGAGTTVTKDVPRSALALTRIKQVNVEGWADRFREAQAKRDKKQTDDS